MRKEVRNLDYRANITKKNKDKVLNLNVTNIIRHNMF